MNKNKYIKNLEREIKKLLRRIDDWRDTALDLQENINNRIYEAEVQLYYSWWTIVLILLCGILAGFDYFILFYGGYYGK